ncbi:hypothetical protein [Gorillibacterium timonense]|uniref:hypothetical protein n=1 Tax=Gorillibacterium timonense TaxID=1689269 RepID=UPI00071CB502|nr:hypothetical protein [Gorillibacterium timonense]
MPQTATITGLVFSIRDEELEDTDEITGEIFRSVDCGVTSVATGIKVTITAPDCCGSATGNLQVNQCDLLSVKVTAGSALQDGAAATILLQV